MNITVPGFGILAEEDAEQAWQSWMRKILALPMFESVRAEAGADSEAKIETNGTNKVNGLAHKKDLIYEVTDLERALRETLIKQRLEFWPESKSISETKPIILYETGPLLKGNDKIEGILGKRGDLLRTASISIASPSSGCWAFEISLAHQDQLVEIGWSIVHTLNGEKHQDFARLVTKYGEFWFQDHKIKFLPATFRFNVGDTICCLVNIDTLTFSFTINGRILPDILFVKEAEDDTTQSSLKPSPTPFPSSTSSSSSPTPPAPTSSFISPNTNHSPYSAQKTIPAPHSSCQFKVKLGADAAFSAAVGNAITARINLGQTKLSIKTDYLPLCPPGRMPLLEKQCNTILEVLKLVVPHCHGANPPSKTKRTMRDIYSNHTSSVVQPKLREIVDLLLYSEEVGLISMFKDAFNSEGDLVEGFSQQSWLYKESVVPFILSLLEKGLTFVGSITVLDNFVSLLRNDQVCNAVLAGIAAEVCGSILLSNNPLKVRHPEMLCNVTTHSWDWWVEALTAICNNHRWLDIISNNNMILSIANLLFSMPVYNHWIRIEPYIPKEHWPLLENFSDESYLIALEDIRKQIDHHIARFGDIARILGSHLPAIPPPNPSEPSSEPPKRPPNAFLVALRKHVIGGNSDCLRGKSAPYHTTAHFNGLFFSLLSAISTSNEGQTDATFANTLLGDLLLDPSRSIVDRLGGTFGHVQSEYPNPIGEAQVNDPRCLELNFPGSETPWRFEFLDACVYLFHHSVLPSIAFVQELANELIMSKRMMKDTARAREARPSRNAQDLRMLDLANKHLSIHNGLQGALLAIGLLDEHPFYLLWRFSAWLSKTILACIRHPTRSKLIHYIPEMYPLALVMLEEVIDISRSPTVSIVTHLCRWVLPQDLPNDLHPEDHEVEAKAYGHAPISCALMRLLSNNCILNPNLRTSLIYSLSNVVSGSLGVSNLIYGPKRFEEYLCVLFNALADSKSGYWSAVLGGFMPFLSSETPTGAKYREYFRTYLNTNKHLQSVEAGLNSIFNLISWTENELDTHIDHYIEHLRRLTSNVELIIAESTKDSTAINGGISSPVLNRMASPDINGTNSPGPAQAENARPERRPPMEERGFKRSLAGKNWHLITLSEDKVLVSLPLNPDERIPVLKGLASISAQSMDVILREAPAFSVILMNLLMLLSKISQYATHLFESSLIMTRTCESIGHTLRRILESNGSPPIVKLLRLLGRTIQPMDNIRFAYANNYDFYDFSVVRLVWLCTDMIATLLHSGATRPALLQNLSSLLPNHVVDLYLSLNIHGIDYWKPSSQDIFSAVKLTSTREILLRSGQEECPICYTNPVDTTFIPCRHRSCKSCIDRHLLNNTKCFFCKAHIDSVKRD